MELNTELLKRLQELLYWKSRCKAAEDFINKSPSDHDINENQKNAYYYWKEICNIKPENYLINMIDGYG